MLSAASSKFCAIIALSPAPTRGDFVQSIGQWGQRLGDGDYPYKKSAVRRSAQHTDDRIFTVFGLLGIGADTANISAKGLAQSPNDTGRLQTLMMTLPSRLY